MEKHLKNKYEFNVFQDKNQFEKHIQEQKQTPPVDTWNK
jgi:hypothetical protein